MALSAVGSMRFKVYGVLLLVNIIVLALSGHINHFQGFYYKADVFPFALSLATTVFLLTMLFLDINFKNSFTARPPFELAWLFITGIAWLAFNAFSTSRWRYVSLGLCGTIPSGSQFSPYRTWCHELQALRAFVWIEWVIFLFTFAYLLLWAISEHKKGRSDVWSTSMSRFEDAPTTARSHTPSEFLQWEKFPQTSEPQTNFNQDNESQYPQQERTRPIDIYPTPPPPSQYMQQHVQQTYTQYISPSRAQFAQNQHVYYGEPSHVI